MPLLGELVVGGADDVARLQARERPVVDDSAERARGVDVCPGVENLFGRDDSGVELACGAFGAGGVQIRDDAPCPARVQLLREVLAGAAAPLDGDPDVLQVVSAPAGTSIPDNASTINY